MKKITASFAAAAVFLAAAIVVAKQDPQAPAAVQAGGGKVDIDLTKMNAPMVYARVFDMMQNPRGYAGKSVRMRGSYSTVFDPATSNRYHACFISDAAACCAQGVEFSPTNCTVYPADFPSEGAPILVQGVFETYLEDGNEFSRVANAVLAFRRRK